MNETQKRHRFHCRTSLHPAEKEKKEKRKNPSTKILRNPHPSLLCSCFPDTPLCSPSISLWILVDFSIEILSNLSDDTPLFPQRAISLYFCSALSRFRETRLEGSGFDTEQIDSFSGVESATLADSSLFSL